MMDMKLRRVNEKMDLSEEKELFKQLVELINEMGDDVKDENGQWIFTNGMLSILDSIGRKYAEIKVVQLGGEGLEGVTSRMRNFTSSEWMDYIVERLKYMENENQLMEVAAEYVPRLMIKLGVEGRLKAMCAPELMSMKQRELGCKCLNEITSNMGKEGMKVTAELVGLLQDAHDEYIELDAYKKFKDEVEKRDAWKKEGKCETDVSVRFNEHLQKLFELTNIARAGAEEDMALMVYLPELYKDVTELLAIDSEDEEK